MRKTKYRTRRVLRKKSKTRKIFVKKSKKSTRKHIHKRRKIRGGNYASDITVNEYEGR